VAASGPIATRLAGEIGDGFITTSGKGEELYTDRLLPALGVGAAKFARRPAELDMVMEVKVSFDSDLDHAREVTKFWGALALSPEEKVGVWDPVEVETIDHTLVHARRTDVAHQPLQ